MKANSGTSRIKTNKHDKKYWDRLKRQFRKCEYDHTGAYCGQGLQPKSRARKKIEKRIEECEQMIKMVSETEHE